MSETQTNTTTPGGRPLPQSTPPGYMGNTPLLKVYFSTRAQHPGIILLMRVGDFFEAYGDDAERIASDLNITLTGRDDGGLRIPMAGVPHHATERYVARLIAKGRRVALMDQVEDPKYAKGLVKRKVTRVVTPGTILEDNMLDAKSNNYLVAAVVGDPVAGVGIVDVSTGEFLTTEIEGDNRLQKLLDEISRLEPAEILIQEECDEELVEAIRASCSGTVTPFSPREGHSFRGPTSRDVLLTHFQTQSLRGFGCEEYTAGLDACALVLRYLQETQVNALPHIRTLSTYSAREFMVLDAPARRHLELTVSMSEGGRSRTLLGVLDETLTPMGGRLLRRWLEEPLLDVGRIQRRHEAVDELAHDVIRRGDLRDLLRGMGDMERLVSRAAAGLANARDLVALKNALLRLPEIADALTGLRAEKLQDLRRRLACPPEIAQRIAQAITDDPPAGLREGGMIRAGYSEELDRLLTASADAKIWIANLEATERERTNIASLKVGYNAVFGYYIEVTKSNLAKVPSNYIRKQTTANGERYITPELKEYEALVLGADEKAVELEYELFLGVRERVAEASPDVLAVARAVSELDVLAGFAEIALKNAYVRPEVNDEDAILIAGGRHPVIEHLGVGGPYIPNDCRLDAESRMYIITGPNMSGKSSYLRQVALIVLMAQIGSFVPADSATIGIVDRIFTRVGAHDELASGQSTFMVEMNETANILNNATPRSLVVLDEIGRGTSTYDGLSIAWAVAEFLTRVDCKTLFATHYHHLNELAKHFPTVRNYRVAVKEQGDHIVWLRKLVPGGTDRSYGIQVARMAGVPVEVVERAKEVLKGLERGSAGATRDLVGSADGVEARTQKVQLTLFEAEKHPILEELETLDVTALTPVEALMKLDEWKRRSSRSS
ncbi:MAG TPA: DNA mismatch repair protein MutS [Chthonomonadaceae bacterium]|nr:DNA mismatch repair protein MutS [Chthonomonadaceae bacterium]